jgi:hypothetical protein
MNDLKTTGVLTPASQSKAAGLLRFAFYHLLKNRKKSGSILGEKK